MRIFIFSLIFISDFFLTACGGCSSSKKNLRPQSQKNSQGTEAIIDINKPKDEEDISEKFKNEDSVNEIHSTFKVIGIVDGDTYDILKQNKPERIRMDGIDAPEKGMPYNKVSKKFLSDLIFGKFIKIKYLKFDRHRRAVCQTFLPDGTDVSLEMIRAGMAWHYKQYSSNLEYSQLEVEARNQRLGLWQENNPIEPWIVRKLHRQGISTKEKFKNSIK